MSGATSAPKRHAALSSRRKTILVNARAARSCGVADRRLTVARGVPRRYCPGATSREIRVSDAFRCLVVTATSAAAGIAVVDVRCARPKCRRRRRAACARPQAALVSCARRAHRRDPRLPGGSWHRPRRSRGERLAARTRDGLVFPWRGERRDLRPPQSRILRSRADALPDADPAPHDNRRSRSARHGAAKCRRARHSGRRFRGFSARSPSWVPRGIRRRRRFIRQSCSAPTRIAKPCAQRT